MGCKTEYLTSKHVCREIIISLMVIVFVFYQFSIFKKVYAVQTIPGIQKLEEGITDYESGNYEDAIFSLEMATIQISEDDKESLWKAHFHLGLSYHLTGDNDESRKQFVKAQGIIKNKSPDVLMHSPKVVKLFKESTGFKEKKVGGKEIVAIVNGVNIFRKDFDRRLNVFRRLNQDVTLVAKMQIVNQLTKKELLRQFVGKQNISASSKEVEAELEKIKFFLQNNPSNAGKPMEEILETQGSSISELKEEVSRALALSKYLENLVTDADKRSYFYANKDAFNDSRVKASHILIDTRGMKTDAELDEAKRKINTVKREIDNGADFFEMAKKHSDCPSAEKRGDIGYFQRKGSIAEEFAKVAFVMEVGEISGPVKTQFGYHLIKVTGKEKGKNVSYDNVTDMVDFVYMQIETETLLKELHDKAEIEILLPQ
jgi:parvulin-like peptidyl-prolyl isomerase